jgi:hypothetical protein
MTDDLLWHVRSAKSQPEGWCLDFLSLVRTLLFSFVSSLTSTEYNGADRDSRGLGQITLHLRRLPPFPIQLPGYLG